MLLVETLKQGFPPQVRLTAARLSFDSDGQVATVVYTAARMPASIIPEFKFCAGPR